jgi:SAM-dependent methyltransferase
LPIPAEEMREWVERTVEKVRPLGPRRILEIGCGAGLLLFRIAPSCSLYCGTDFSPAALSHVERHLKDLGLPQVSLLRRTAEDFSGLEPESFDLVILNSVAQYLPHIDSLIRILEGAVGVVRPGGSIFVGDVRSLPLLEPFHASVQLHRAPDALPLGRLRQRVRRSVAEEEQLAIDPAFFFALQDRFPRIDHVRVEPKFSRYSNELFKFRYDVFIEIGDSGRSRFRCARWLDWSEGDANIPAILRLLREEGPEALGISRVPDARLAGEVAAWRLLLEPDGLGTAGELRGPRLAAQERGVDPEAFWALRDQAPYTVQIHWAGPGEDDRYHVLLRRRDRTADDVSVPEFPVELGARRPLDAYSNNPAQSRHLRGLFSSLRRFLLTKVPDYMVPAAFVRLDSLPLTPTGKLDRRTLPAIEDFRPARREAHAPPRTRTEEALAGIWAQLLGLDAVGVHDNFFELGGHSLLATRVLSRIRDRFEVELSMYSVFEAPTVAGLGRLVDEARDRGEDRRPAIPRLPREAYAAKLLPGGVPTRETS